MWDTEEPSLISNLHFSLPIFLTCAYLWIVLDLMWIVVVILSLPPSPSCPFLCLLYFFVQILHEAMYIFTEAAIQQNTQLKGQRWI